MGNLSEEEFLEITNLHNPKKFSNKIEVMVMEIDVKKRRIALSYKNTLTNPWEKFGKEFPGTVTLGHFAFNGYDDGTPSTQLYARMRVFAEDVSSGTEKGRIDIDIASIMGDTPAPAEPTIKPGTKPRTTPDTTPSPGPGRRWREIEKAEMLTSKGNALWKSLRDEVEDTYSRPAWDKKIIQPYKKSPANRAVHPASKQTPKTTQGADVVAAVDHAKSLFEKSKTHGIKPLYAPEVVSLRCKSKPVHLLQSFHSRAPSVFVA